MELFTVSFDSTPEKIRNSSGRLVTCAEAVCLDNLPHMPRNVVIVKLTIVNNKGGPSHPCISCTKCLRDYVQEPDSLLTESTPVEFVSNDGTRTPLTRRLKEVYTELQDVQIRRTFKWQLRNRLAISHSFYAMKNAWKDTYVEDRI